MASKRLYYINKITNFLLQTSSDNIKVMDITNSIGVSKKTLYNHFDSKQQLIESLVDVYLKKRIEELDKAMKNGLSPIRLLIRIANIAETTLSDCKHLLTQGGISSNAETLSIIFLKHKEYLLKIVNFSFNKGIKLKIFESDIDALIASQIYLSGLSVLFRSDCILKPNMNSTQEFNTILYHLIKGNCSPSGLNTLRELVDIRVVVA